MSKKIITFPNQKIIHINKPDYKSNYLTIGIDEWIDASKNLTPNTFKLYLYLASNANDYKFALSRQDVMEKLGMSKDSYLRATRELGDKKYITLDKGNLYNFITVPNGSKNATNDDVMIAEMQPVCMQNYTHDSSIEATNIVVPEQPEITNITNKTTLNIDADAKKEEVDLELEELDTLDDNTLCAIRDELKKVKPYMEVKKKYNLKSRLSKDTIGKIERLLNTRYQLNAMMNTYIPEYTEGAEYKPRTNKRKLSKELEDLW